MDNLSRFYIEIATDVKKQNAFNLANQDEKAKMLANAGVKNTFDLLSKDEQDLKLMMAKHLVESTGSWKGLENNAGNDDNKNNIGRLGIKNTH